MDSKDIYNTWGQLRFGATAIEKIADREPEPSTTSDFTVRCCLSQDDGSYIVYACDGGRDQKPWQIYRYRSEDGIQLLEKEKVYESPPGNWSQTTTLNYSADRKLFLCLKNMLVKGGGSTHAYLSRDGTSWEPCPSNPVYIEGDRWGAVWSSAIGRFITYNKGIQYFEGKLTPELLYGGVGLSERWNARRVVTIRTSEDGCCWQPDDPDWSRRGTQTVEGVKRFGGPTVPAEYQIAPDELDPPDLEFYAGTVFEYAGRYYMMMLNYAPCFLPSGTPPVSQGGHGPSLDSEWWISRDGIIWDRPFRDTNGIKDKVSMIQHGPMVSGGRLLFHLGDEVWGMPEDRITFATSRANCVFESRMFPMPNTALKLNAKIPGDQYPEGDIQAYVMAELIDDCNHVLSGYEKEKCQLRPKKDSIAIELHWGDKTGAEFEGRKVRVRFYMRASNIYALTD